MELDYIKNYITTNYISVGKKFVKFDVANKEIWEAILKLTDFLPVTAKIPQRIWHVMNDHFEPVICKGCDEHVKWGFKDYKTFCSTQCSNVDPEKKRKAEETFILKYGGVGAASSHIFEKIKETTLQNHGVETYMNHDEFANKSERTIYEKYGVKHYSQTEESRKRLSESTIENSREIIKKAKSTNRKRYGVDSYAKTKEFRTRHIKKMRERYGTDSFKQSILSPDSLSKLSDPDFMRSEHILNKKSCQHISRELGVHISTVIRYLDKHGIEQKYYFESDEQKEVTEFVQSLGFKTITNDRTLINPFELDIYIPEKRLAIEYCGLFWHSELHKDKHYHADKRERCEEKDIRLVTLFQNEWVHNKGIVKDKIAHLLGRDETGSIFARKCRIETLDRATKRDFLNSFHIQGDGLSSINFGLYHGVELVAVIGFKKMGSKYELNRFASSRRVVGGFSKLLKHFEREFDYPPIITFADLRWSNGDLYYTTGFTMDKKLPPDYSYISGDRLIHKFNFRHKNMSKFLENYDDTLSETENAHRNSFYRIFDCGKLRFVKNF